MTFDIIVPHYKEPWSVCKYLFDTISTQRMVHFKDIHVILVNDGEDCGLELSEADLLHMYPFVTEVYTKPHEGVSAARNYGLDQATADYVMFCDADDGFLNNLALYMIGLEAAKGANIINPIFMEESFNARENKMILCTHRSDGTFLHGKAYKRQFLVDEGIRFPKGLNLHEDGYFNSLAICAGQDHIVEINTPLYLWRWNKDSVVRKQHDFTLRTYDKLCEQWRLTLTWLKEHGYEKEYRHVVCKAVISTYYNFQCAPYLSIANAKYKREAEKAFKRLYTGISKDFQSCNTKMIAQFCSVLRQEGIDQGIFWYELQDLNSWIKHIEHEVK